MYTQESGVQREVQLQIEIRRGRVPGEPRSISTLCRPSSETVRGDSVNMSGIFESRWGKMGMIRKRD